MKWNVKFLLKNFRKKTKSKNKKRIAIIVQKRNEKTNRKKRDTQKNRRNRQSIKKNRKNRKENDIKWFWNRKFHEIESKISLFFFDRETKKHRHRNTETINNDRYRINKIIFFDKWYRWDHRRIKQTKMTNFNISQRNFHEIVETLKNFHSHDRKDSDDNDFKFLIFFLKSQTKSLTETTKKQKSRLRRKFSNEQRNVFVFFHSWWKEKKIKE